MPARKKSLTFVIGLAFFLYLLALPAWAVQGGVPDGGVAAVLQAVNAARSEDGAAPLSSDPALTAVAQRCAGAVAAGKAPPDAFAALRGAGVGYRYAARLTVRSSQPALVGAVLARDGMATLDPKYTRIGIGRSGSAWVVLLADGGASAPAPASPASPVPPPAPGTGKDTPPGQDRNQAFLSAAEQAMLDLVNAARREAGLAPLVPDPNLTRLARMKAQDMVDRGYFDHYSPTYGSPFDMMRASGVTYRYAGENIAGAPTVARAHEALMQSPGHRANILGKNYTRVGIGIVDGGPYGKMFVQLFTG